jgi:RNA-directed DNA polymerase
VSCEVHARFCERPWGRFPRSTHLVITGSSKELLETEVKPLVEQFLRDRGLELSQEKTRITHITDGFEFLGQQVRAYNGKILVTPSRKSVHTILEKVRRLIKVNAQATTGNLISQLNPLIRAGLTITGT